MTTVHDYSHNSNNQSLMRVSSSPLMSIVTVVRNREQALTRTMQSVIEQTYDNIEYIIIDGGSSDGTVQRIREYEKHIDFWISEPDSGIYDAMNKGIDRATGEWIIFLNAGDVFADPNTVSRIFSELRDDTDVLYGRHEELFDSKHSRKPALGDLRDLWKGMVFCHQSMLVRTALMKASKFNTQNCIAADFEFIASLQAQQHRFQALDILISKVLADGYSSSNNLSMIRQQWLISKRFFGNTLSIDIYYLASLASVSIKNSIKRCFPRHIANYLRSRSVRRPLPRMRNLIAASL